MADIEKGRTTFERNIEAQSGRSVATWSKLVQQSGFARHGEMVGWLKAEHGLSHSHANHIAKQAMADVLPADHDAISVLFEGKAQLRPLYDRLVAAAEALGPDVEIAPKKANVSVRRARQFALLQPSTRTRLDLGLILKGRETHGRLEPSGSFHAMFTHRVRLETLADIDAEVLALVKEAYDAAG
jgi:predicted transport protein